MTDVTKLLAQRNYAAALAALPEFEALKHDAIRLNWRGTALAGLHQSTEAKQCFERAIDLEPDEPRYRLSLAMLVSGAEPERAQHLFQEAIALNPNAAAAHLGLGQLAARRGEIARAESLFRTALRAQPELPTIYFGLGHLLIQQGKIDDALRVISQGLARNDKDPDGLAAMGRGFMHKGTPEFARKALDNALAIDPRHSAALLFATELALHQKRFQDADQHVRALRERHPQDSNATRLEVELALQLGDAVRARRALDQFLALRPGSARATLQRANLCPNYGEAVTLILAQIAHSDQQRALWTAAAQLASQHDQDYALAVIRQWTQAEPEDSWAWNHLCTVAEIQREFAAAESAALRAESLDPQLVQAQLVLSRAELRKGEPGLARTRLERLLVPPAKPAEELLYPQQRFEAERLLGRACALLDDGEAALNSWLRAANRADVRRVAALPAEFVRHVAPSALADPHRPVCFLMGAPGCGAELVAMCLQFDPRVRLLADRWLGVEPRRDVYSERSRAAEPWSSNELLHVRKRYLDRLKRVAPDPSVMAIDWLPELDVRIFDVVRAALPQARFLIVQRDPRDALLDAVSMAGNVPGAGDAIAVAQAIRTQKKHLSQLMMAKGDHVVPLLFEFWLADPDRELAKLAQNLSLPANESQAKLDLSRMLNELSDLPRFWPSQSWKRFESQLAQAYATFQL